jgi:hypothetical protein
MYLRGLSAILWALAAGALSAPDGIHKEKNMRRLVNRARKWTLSVALGSGMALGGCDPTVRDTVLTGVEGASTTLITTLIQAFFETLQPEEEGEPTTV